MIDLSALSHQSFYLVGLGVSGTPTATALRDAGARVAVWDDGAIPEVLSTFATPPAEADYAGFDALILSPGIPLTHPAAQGAQAAGLEIIGDVELAFRAGIKARTIGITGTNGKSTTTALVHHTLAELGVPAVIGGNFGPAALTMDDPGEDGFVVLELSSYQLDLSPGYPLDAACLLNITPDHLERHGTLEDYAAAKARIFRNAKTGVITGADAESLAISRQTNIPVLEAADWALYPETPALRGEHNQQNMAATAAMLSDLGFEEGAVRAAMATFKGVAHRQEILGQAGGWTFVNDSKATNVDAAVRALTAFDDIHWLVGGRGKAGGLDDLAPGLPHVTKAYIYGENRAEVAAYCASQDVPHAVFETLDEAVASAMTAQGGTLLLAPAAASWDQYRSFEVRGDAFRSLIQPHLDKP